MTFSSFSLKHRRKHAYYFFQCCFFIHHLNGTLSLDSVQCSMSLRHWPYCLLSLLRRCNWAATATSTLVSSCWLPPFSTTTAVFLSRPQLFANCLSLPGRHRNESICTQTNCHFLSPTLHRNNLFLTAHTFLFTFSGNFEKKKTTFATRAMFSAETEEGSKMSLVTLVPCSSLSLLAN